MDTAQLPTAVHSSTINNIAWWRDCAFWHPAALFPFEKDTAHNLSSDIGELQKKSRRNNLGSVHEWPSGDSGVLPHALLWSGCLQIFSFDLPKSRVWLGCSDLIAGLGIQVFTSFLICLRVGAKSSSPDSMLTFADLSPSPLHGSTCIQPRFRTLNREIGRFRQSALKQLK